MEDDDWACLTLAEFDADFAESGEAATAGKSRQHGDEELRLLLQQRASALGISAEVFFSADLTLKGLAAELHGILVQVETLQQDAAALIASARQGPLKPPEEARGRFAGSKASRHLCASEVFGLGARANAAPPSGLDAPAPSSATGGLVDYQRLLEGLPPALFVERRLRLSFGDVNTYQDSKDIGRDNLVINGVAIAGACGGYTAAVAALKAALQQADATAWHGGARGGEIAVERGAQLLLSVLNRTSSGFAAFEEVLRLFDCPEVVVVSPESAQAKPLEATVLEGVVLGRAHTRYSVVQADGSGAPLAVIDAVFVFRVSTAMLRRLIAEEPSASQQWPADDICAPILLSLNVGGTTADRGGTGEAAAQVA
eukprot:TRINITY_DN23835_c0_g1_i1.p1 TRINITY_DN23835_c0_g1~~TRINITY_DN23835_c0_g1_i1.p1  ORF type:complete len:371 (+),score=77.24 TRINITY_DN23835_c0_g1_i1:91-1203(+)